MNFHNLSVCSLWVFMVMVDCSLKCYFAKKVRGYSCDDLYPWWSFASDMDLAVIVNVFMSVVAYVATDNLICSPTIIDSFIKANLFGKDLNKTSENKV